MHMFYIPELSPETQVLPPDESHHCVKVLRLKPQDQIYLGDGKGRIYRAQIQDDQARSCSIQVLDWQEAPPKNYRIQIVMAPPKRSDRLEWFIEKAVEIGVDHIRFILCERSERKVVKLERLYKVAISAFKQSMNFFLPQIDNIQPYPSVIGEHNQDYDRYLAYLDPEKSVPLVEALAKESNCSIFIGPEGDFSETELDIAWQNQLRIVSLGQNRLRTETAALVACHTCHLINQLSN